MTDGGTASDIAAAALQGLRREACRQWMEMLTIGEMAHEEVLSAEMLARGREALEGFGLGGLPDGGLARVFWAMMAGGAMEDG